ncbi:MAG: caspase family protein [Bacteroidia bacterium]|nr:caspase family protein [Bacteroidia bacterium]
MAAILKTWLPVILFNICINSFSQQPELRIQKGHGQIFAANYSAYSTDGKYVATAGGNNIIIWDVPTGRELKSFDGRDPVCFSPDGKQVAFVAQDSGSTFNTHIKIVDYFTGDKIALLKGHTNIVTTLAYSPDKPLLVSGSSDKTIRCWDLKNYQVKYILTKHTQWVTKIKFSPDGSFFASGSGDKTVVFWDPETGKELKIFNLFLSTVNSIDFSPDSKKLASYENEFDAKPVIKIIDINSQKELNSFTGLGPVLFAKGGGSLIYQDDKARNMILKNCVTDSIEQIFTGHTDYIFGTCLSPDGKYFVTTAQDKQIRFWEVSTGKDLGKFKGSSAAVLSVAITPDNKYLLDGYGFLNLQMWEVMKPKVISKMKYSCRFSIRPDGKYAACEDRKKSSIVLVDIASGETLKELLKTSWMINDLCFSPDGKWLAVAESGVTLINMENGKQILLKKIDRASVYTVCFSPDSKYLAAGGNDGILTYWDIINNKRNCKIKTKQRSIHKALFSKDGKYLITGSSDYTIKLWDFENKKELLSYPKQLNSVTSMCITADGKFVVVSTYGTAIGVYDILTGKEHFILKGNVTSVHDVCCSADGKYIISGSDDGQIKFYDAKNGNEVATFISLSGPGNEYIVYTPDGYYMSTKKGTDAVHFVKDNKVFLFDQYDMQYNRPDIILKRLSYVDSAVINSYRMAYLKRLKKLNFSENMFSHVFHIPEIVLENKNNIPLTTRDKKLLLKILAKDTEFKLDRINVWINDVPVFGVNGINLRDENTKQFSKQLEVDLMNGKNKIEISCLNEKGVESLRENLEIKYEPKEAFKSDLYIVSIGVSEYHDKQFNLTYAAKDAIDFSSIFKEKKQSPGETFTLLITNKNATKENILKAKEFLKQSKPDDQVLVFIASHGLLDEKLDYYFATTDVDFNHPSLRGMSYDELENLVDGIPALKKLIFIDACHSGEVDKDEVELTAVKETSIGDVKFRGFNGLKNKENSLGLQNSFELMQTLFADLRRGSGAMVISSAGGKEFAFESKNWKNGVFTYALLEGLKTGHADKNKDKQITVSELRDYISDCVQKLTNGKQNPTSRKENLEFDFRVW